jgi:hypothetical protein
MEHAGVWARGIRKVDLLKGDTDAIASVIDLLADLGTTKKLSAPIELLPSKLLQSTSDVESTANAREDTQSGLA